MMLPSNEQVICLNVTENRCYNGPSIYIKKHTNSNDDDNETQKKNGFRNVQHDVTVSLVHFSQAHFVCHLVCIPSLHRHKPKDNTVKVIFVHFKIVCLICLRVGQILRAEVKEKIMIYV